MLAWFIAGSATAAFAALWLFTVRQKLSRQKLNLEGAAQQVDIKREMYERAKQTPNEKAAAEMLKTDLRIYNSVAHDYNESLKFVPNRIPAILLGFKTAGYTNSFIKDKEYMGNEQI